MRETERSVLQNSWRPAIRLIRVTAVVLSVGLVLGTTAVRAEDDDEEDVTFERGLIDNLMSGIGAKRIDDGGIQYRERSPLVVPSRTTLPPPSAGKRATAPNWPKDPDVAERQAAIEAAKKSRKTPEEERMPLMPSELATKAPRVSRQKIQDTKPGENSSAPLMPSELGYNGGLFSNIFKGSKPDTATFTSEPARETLTQPPVGYQTPSSNYAYGVETGTAANPGYKEVYDSSSGKTTRVPTQ